MMNELVIVIRPFMCLQHAYVVKDGRTEKEEDFLLKNISDFIFNHKDINKVSFIGDSYLLNKIISKEKENQKNKNIVYEIRGC